MKPIQLLVKCSLLSLWLMLSLSVYAAENEANYQFNISGVEKNLANNIQIFLNELTLSCSTSESMRAAIKEKIPHQVRMALQPFGYYQPRVKKIQFSSDETCWQTEIEVDAGEAVRIRNVDFSIEGPGRDHPELKALNPGKYIQKGQIFVDPNYQQLKQKLRQWANNHGYFDASFSQHQVDVYTQQQAADIQLIFMTGPRYRLDQVKIEQSPEFMDPQFLQRFVGLESGQYINNQSLVEVRQRLVSSQYFGNINVTFGEKNTREATIPVLIKLTPGHRIDYSVGLGFTTDTGTRATFEYHHHRLNERGFQLSSQLQLAEINSDLTARMKFPSISNPDEKWYETELGYRQENNDVYKANTAKAGVSQTRLQSNKWQNINFIDLLSEDYSIGDQKQTTRLLVPGTAWTFQHVDDPLNPRFGFKAQMDLKLATESIFSDMSMFQISGRVKAILPVSDRDRLIMRAEIGTTSTSDFNELPATYRYFAGGDQSVRGFDYKRLSPRNEDDELVGGKHLAVASVEYEHRLNDNYALAVFTDGGNAFTDQFEMAASVGVGFRWFSPIGPLRVDLGIPVTDSENSFRIHLSLGPDL